MNRGGQRYLYLRDHQGSVMALVDSAGQIVNKYRYDPWGIAESTVEGVANPLQYNGRDLDTSTDLYYYRARYYSPGLGRLISEDPVGLNGGINPYVYVGDDPVNNEDPSGLCTQRKPFGGKTSFPWGQAVEGYATCAQIQMWELARLAEGTGSRFGRRDQMDEGPIPGSVKPGPQPGRIEQAREAAARRVEQANHVSLLQCWANGNSATAVTVYGAGRVVLAGVKAGAERVAPILRRQASQGWEEFAAGGNDVFAGQRWAAAGRWVAAGGEGAAAALDALAVAGAIYEGGLLAGCIWDHHVWGDNH
jgi:RHS repeat-associated protein